MWQGAKWACSLMKFGLEWGGKDWSPASGYGEGWIDSVCDLMGPLPVKSNHAWGSSEYRHQARGFKLVGLGISEDLDEREEEEGDAVVDA